MSITQDVAGTWTGTWTGPRRLARVYAGLLRAEVQAASTYRSQLVLGALGWVVPVAFMALWRGAASGGAVDGIDAGQFTTYFAVILLTTSLQLSRNLSFGIEPLVWSGQLSALLLRPHHPVHALVARGLAELTYKLSPLVVVVPLLVVGLGGVTTSDVGQWLLAALLVPLGFVCEVYLALIMGSLALWITRSSAVTGLLFGFEWVLGGLVAPVVLLPGVLPEVLRHQPLWFALGAPAEAISGISVLTPWVLAEAAAWALLLHLAFARLWRAGTRRYEAVGT
jgi:ABC-2 type transport system permease protein